VKDIPIYLDKLRHLKFDLNSFCLLEERFGTIEKALQELERGVLRAVRTILWVGLSHEDPELTEEDAGKLVNIGNLDMVGLTLLQALGEKYDEGCTSAPH
jgi:hypothetical protein